MAEIKVNPLFNIHEKYREVIIINPYRFTKIPIIGEVYGGGIVAYILQPADPGYEIGKTKGLIAATSDQSSGIAWITGGSTQTTLNGNTLAAIGTGAANTAAMASQTGYTGGAAKVCLDYRGGGYADWYLPSLNELTTFYAYVTLLSITTARYQTSTEYNATRNQTVLFSNNTFTNSSKSSAYRVRAVRSFIIG